MRPSTRTAAAAAFTTAVLAALAGTATAASAATTGGAGDSESSGTGSRAVFVQTDDPAGNHVVAYHRAADGRLFGSHTYATGGVGGVLTGSVVDHTASQGALALDSRAGLLYAVNAGSDTVSVFAVAGDRLRLQQVIGSGGTFPVSIAVHGHEVYVLNARSGGTVQGFVEAGGRLVTLPGSSRGLGLDPTATPEFTHTPGQVAFSPDGSKLLVTTKGNTSAVEVFAVGRHGGLSATPTVTSLPGAVPFALTFDPAGHVVLAEAGTNSVATFTLGHDGALTQLSSLATGQAATCWIVARGWQFYLSNAGSATLTGVASDHAGQLASLGQTGTDAGTVDAAVTPGGRYLYVQGGAAGTIDEFAVNADGSLAALGSVVVPNASGAEGIAAS